MIFSEETLTTVSSLLFEVAAEADPDYRCAKLNNILQDITGDEQELLELILSFMLSGVIDAPKPRFNNTEYVNLSVHIGEWFTLQKTSSFYKLPYIAQTILYFMSKTSHISLKTSHIAAIEFMYTEPITWLAENVVIQDIASNRCRLCHEQIADKRELCNNCKTGLSQWANYRSKDFTVTLTHKNCAWISLPTIHHGNFIYIHEQYKISRIDLHTIKYEIYSGNFMQLQLPITEYQYSL